MSARDAGAWVRDAGVDARAGRCTPSVRLASGLRTENVDCDEREKAADGEGA